MVASLPFIVLLPLIGAAILGLGGLLFPAFRSQEKLIGAIGSAMVAIPFLILVYLTATFTGEPITFELWSWMKAGGLDISFSYMLDQLSLLMGLIVTGVGALIHIYSIGYMHGDEGFYKFFTYLNLFIFAMLNLILGDNMVVMFLGWEGVGLCSYLLIGFWYTDMLKAKAAQKAFVANRIGDFALLVAMFLIFTNIHSFAFGEINAQVAALADYRIWIPLLIFIAATGKSAQIPLFVWLPDAMAGPTPVSALIHAATMVTSGIYLIARLSPLFLASPEIMLVIGIVACLTALIAALIAIAQNDIKKILAYSTVSQLGFMFMALGVGAFTTAIFHVMTHAFFKACLFLGSGSVIHAMEHVDGVEDPQDIRTMGGLSKYMPSTSRTFWISTLAIAGIPLLSGFFSKDEILSSLFFGGYTEPVYWGIWGIALFTALLTAFYMTRVAYLTFNGMERFPKGTSKPHESPALMTVPLWILAVLAIFGGYLGLPALLHVPHVLNDFWLATEGGVGAEGLIRNAGYIAENMHAHHSMEYILLPLSALIAVGTWFLTRRFYNNNGLGGDNKVQQFLGGFYRTMENKFYVDELYEKTILNPFMLFSKNIVAWVEKNVVDGFVRGTYLGVANVGEVFKRLQTGLVQNYLLLVSFGVILVLAYIIFT
ncbi:MAG: NADH-quinone oxidoreductase subunit L [Bacteroidota bacterium]